MVFPIVSGTKKKTKSQAMKLKMARTMNRIHRPDSSSIKFRKTELTKKLIIQPKVATRAEAYASR